jgi:uncharacterized protein (DUF2252 family)
MQEYTHEAREQSGRKARERCSRVAQADWNPKLRKSKPIDILNHSEKGRVPSLLPEKHKRMLVSPFAYYRGSATVMAADLSLLPNTGLIAQLCGDAHAYNLGSFAGLDGHIIFDINDYDETIPGPWEWDVKRMAASLVLVGRESGASDDSCKVAVLSFVRRYRETMRELSQMPVVELARYQVLRHPERTAIAPVPRRAQLSTNRQAFAKLAKRQNGSYVFKQSRVSSAVAAKVKQAIHDYSLSLLPERRHFLEQYRIADVGFRVVGCGSVGMRDYVALMLAGAEDPLFLQVKEEGRSCYAVYLPDARVPENQGQRAAEGQRAMQLQSDIFLGWTTFDGRDYLVRQLRDHKASIADKELRGRGLEQYAEVCAELLAKGHARSGDSCALFGYMSTSPKFDKAIAKFALAYADQITQDYEAYKRALGGREKKTGPPPGGAKAGEARAKASKKQKKAKSAASPAR